MPTCACLPVRARVCLYAIFRACVQEAGSIDIAALEQSGKVSAHWQHFDVVGITKLRYVAHTLDYISLLHTARTRQEGVWEGAGVGEEGGGWIAIFEDDVCVCLPPPPPP